MRQFFYYSIIVIVACLSSVPTQAASKLTPNARLALFQEQVLNKSSHQLNANNTIASIRLVVEVDAQGPPAPLNKSESWVAQCCPSLVTRR